MLTFASRTGAGTHTVYFDDQASFDAASGLHKMIIGRAPRGECATLSLRGRPFPFLLNSVHAFLTRDRYNRFFVYDVSRTGTYVNDSRVATRMPHPLADGDTVSFGATASLLLGTREHANPYAVTFKRTAAPRTSLARGRRPPRTAARKELDRDTVLGAVSCQVCMRPMTEASNLACGHVFCRSCAHTWLCTHATCPTCRHPASVEDARPVVGFSELSEVVVAAHGTHDDIASLAVRLQHGGLDASPSVAAERRTARPVQLVPQSADEETVLFRGSVDGTMRTFVVFRAALEDV